MDRESFEADPEPEAAPSGPSLSESMEDYIEAISELEERLKVVRVKNIAEALSVKMPSVSSALSALSKRRLVNYEKYDYVELTDEGQRVAVFLRRRHAVLKKFLTEVLDVGEADANRDSCGMEHHVSKSTIDNLVKFIEFIDVDPNKRRLDLESFRAYLRGEDDDRPGRTPPA